jgi:hypothetical protein
LDLTLDHPVEIRMKSALEEGEEPETEPKEGTMISEFSEGLGRIEAGIKVFENMIETSG